MNFKKKKGWGETSITYYIWCMGRGGGAEKRKWKRRRTNFKIVKNVLDLLKTPKFAVGLL